ncbi:pyridoxamine 5'-phosphate oxidase family protein [Sphingobium baderi]|uniref:pyridoxamine 5'-phosphate oxidase family protein n=1 Tax=Sphingobium baderi TaxID=1332080 RepID=UPI002B415048|nr:pyridoxamine 5'-phosphate oxidase family protein [Sphingobium baderi]WRD75884.1 pyridoxamine 5'-phosphate oxidase family protein [Sphingobium baderi]
MLNDDDERPAGSTALNTDASSALPSRSIGAPSSSDTAVVDELVRVVNANQLITFTTMSRNGWPMTSCMHFVLRMEEGRPLIYLFTHDGHRKMDNIAVDRRVSLSALSVDEAAPGKTWLRMQGLCHEVLDPAEQVSAGELHESRPGYEAHAPFVAHQYMPLLRVDVVRAEIFENGRTLAVDFPA